VTNVADAGRRDKGKALRASEIRYRSLFEAARDGILIIDPDTRRITDANPFMSELLGYSHEELLGKTLWDIGIQKDEGASQRAFRELQNTRFIRYEDLPLESKAGVRCDVEFVSNVYEENGRTVIQCNVRDITERKRVEDELRTMEERYRTLFDLGPVAVYSCGPSGVIREFNRRAAQLWGRKPASGDTDERFCGAFKLFRPDGSYMPHDQSPMAEVLAGTIPGARDAEVLIERPDGTRVVVVVSIHPLKDQRGAITGAINCFYDITHRKHAEDAQRRMDVLAASNRKLEREIELRLAAEVVLEASQQHQRQLSHQILHAQEE
jgi:PAS domain S-box-containing protein